MFHLQCRWGCPGQIYSQVTFGACLPYGQGPGKPSVNPQCKSADLNQITTFTEKEDTYQTPRIRRIDFIQKQVTVPGLFYLFLWDVNVFETLLNLSKWEIGLHEPTLRFAGPKCKLGFSFFFIPVRQPTHGLIVTKTAGMQRKLLPYYYCTLYSFIENPGASQSSFQGPKRKNEISNGCLYFRNFRTSGNHDCN